MDGPVDRWTGGEPEELEFCLVVEDAPAPANPPGDEAFQWSADRARALEAALRRIGPASGPRICARLRNLQRSADPAALDEVESWLNSQLPAWRGPVQAEGEQAQAFNEGVAAGADGLNLALEVVALLRAGGPEAALAEPLLEQVEAFFHTARARLWEAEPQEPQA